MLNINCLQIVWRSSWKTIRLTLQNEKHYDWSFYVYGFISSRVMKGVKLYLFITLWSVQTCSCERDEFASQWFNYSNKGITHVSLHVARNNLKKNKIVLSVTSCLIFWLRFFVLKSQRCHLLFFLGGIYHRIKLEILFE